MSSAEVDALYRRWGGVLWACVYERFGPEVAEEATSTVWLRVIQGRIRLENRTGIWTYLKTSAIWEASHITTRGWPGSRGSGAKHPRSLDEPIGRRGYLLGETLPSPAQTPEEAAEVREELLTALGAIPERYRRTWEAFLAGLTYEEIAEENDLTWRQVDRYLRKGRDRMREAVAA